ncbi:MAG: hypothetical protein HYV07_29790 [Deltaproteobacteria bacterium]|nr:hypothetical protein [Deltaproteobacteria bacterium]
MIEVDSSRHTAALRWVEAGAPLNFEASPGFMLLVLASSELQGAEGEDVAATVSARWSSSPPPRDSCGRCSAERFGRPQLLFPGDACPVPASARGYTESGVASSEDVDAMRSNVTLDRVGPCSCPGPLGPSLPEGLRPLDRGDWPVKGIVDTARGPVAVTHVGAFEAGTEPPAGSCAPRERRSNVANATSLEDGSILIARTPIQLSGPDSLTFEVLDRATLELTRTIRGPDSTLRGLARVGSQTLVAGQARAGFVGAATLTSCHLDGNAAECQALVHYGGANSQFGNIRAFGSAVAVETRGVLVVIPEVPRAGSVAEAPHLSNQDGAIRLADGTSLPAWVYTFDRRAGDPSPNVGSGSIGDRLITCVSRSGGSEIFELVAPVKIQGDYRRPQLELLATCPGVTCAQDVDGTAMTPHFLFGRHEGTAVGMPIEDLRTCRTVPIDARVGFVIDAVESSSGAFVRDNSERLDLLPPGLTGAPRSYSTTFERPIVSIVDALDGTIVVRGDGTFQQIEPDGTSSAPHALASEGVLGAADRNPDGRWLLVRQLGGRIEISVARDDEPLVPELVFSTERGSDPWKVDARWVGRAHGVVLLPGSRIVRFGPEGAAELEVSWDAPETIGIETKDIEAWARPLLGLTGAGGLVWAYGAGIIEIDVISKSPSARRVPFDFEGTDLDEGTQLAIAKGWVRTLSSSCPGRALAGIEPVGLIRLERTPRGLRARRASETNLPFAVAGLELGRILLMSEDFGHVESSDGWASSTGLVDSRWVRTTHHLFVLDGYGRAFLGSECK